MTRENTTTRPGTRPGTRTGSGVGTSSFPRPSLKMVLLAVAALLSCPIAGAVGPQQESSVEALESERARLQVILEASRLESSGDLDGALAIYERLIAADPDDWQVLLGRGSARFRLGRIEESLADFDRVVELEPEREPGLWQRGIAQYYAGRFEACARQFVVHRTVNPNDVENAAWHYLCVAAIEGVERARRSCCRWGPTRESR